jgi:hypothetical protein
MLGWLLLFSMFVYIYLWDRKKTAALRILKAQGFDSPKGLRLPVIGYLSVLTRPKTYEVMEERRVAAQNTPGYVTHAFNRVIVTVHDAKLHPKLWKIIDDMPKVSHPLCMLSFSRFSVFFLIQQRRPPRVVFSLSSSANLRLPSTVKHGTQGASP